MADENASVRVKIVIPDEFNKTRKKNGVNKDRTSPSERKNSVVTTEETKQEKFCPIETYEGLHWNDSDLNWESSLITPFWASS